MAGWGVLMLYIGTAILAWRARRAAILGEKEASKRPRGSERRARGRKRAYRAAVRFWTIMLIVLICLGINKQLDLHTWLTEVGRSLAIDEGWYEQRRIVQRVAVIGVGIATVVLTISLLWTTRSILPRQALAFVGLVLLGCFVLARMASFHHLDDWLAGNRFGIPNRLLIEIAGNACIALCAQMNMRWLRDRKVRDMAPTLTAQPADR